MGTGGTAENTTWLIKNAYGLSLGMSYGLVVL